jgi:Fic family protein
VSTGIPPITAENNKKAIMALDTEIKEYEAARQQYQTSIINQMNREEYIKYNEVLFSTHSCAIEGNSFSVDDTRELKEKGLGMIPAGKTLFEAFEMLDHFEAFEYMMQNTQHPIDEELFKEINKRVTRHTLSYHAPEAVAGEYTTTDMTAGDTVFGNHKELIARVPKLLESTEEAIVAANVHPMILAARFHGFYEYLHPFRDGNGRTGRLVSNYILLRMGHPLLIIPSENRKEYIAALRMIRTEATDEHLIRFFFKMATRRMEEELKQKEANTKRFTTFLF